MATKPITVSPPLAARAGCAATCESYASGHVGEQGYGYTWTNYQCVATAAGAWTFERFVVTFQVHGGTPYTINYWSTPQPPTQVTGEETEPYDVNYDDGDSIVILSVEARFARTKTHLLVNSSTRSSPVRLVYDDRAGGTGKLIADY